MDYPLILAGNRDELHDRPSAPADWWADSQQVFGGRDLVAGGSWLGISRHGRMAVVTNYPGRPAPDGVQTSRGHLVTDYLIAAAPPAEYLDALLARQARFAGFCLVVTTPREARVLSSHGSQSGRHRSLEPGILAITNASLDDPWPKARYLQTAMTRLLAEEPVREERLFELLASREPVAAEGVDLAEPLARARFTPFVCHPDYGTRASTVITVDREGGVRFTERRFDRHGEPAGVSHTGFDIDPAAGC